MSKPKLLLVHGMGQHTADSFKKEFNSAIKDAFNLYSHLAGSSADDFVDIVSIGYNEIFDDYRELMAERSRPINERLKELPNDGIDLATAAKEINEIESNIGEDEFFKTHWLDVIFYRFTVLGELVRIRVAKKIAEAIATVNGGSQRVHLLGHSLGTSVVHDSLAKLYNEKFIIEDLSHLSIHMHKIGSLHLIANTSRVLQSFIDVDKSVVKPGDGGCISRFFEYRHELDPITWPAPFNPTDNGGWISNDSWYFKRYQLIRPTSITSERGNTHSIGHYILNPLVHIQLFKKVFGIQLTDDQITDGHEKYIDQTLSGVAQDLENSLESLRTINLENVAGLIKAAQRLYAFIEK